MSEFDPVDLTDVEPDSLGGTWLKRIAELEADLKDYATAIGQNEQLRKENERLTAVVEAAKDHVEWCRLNRGRGFSRLEQALAAVQEG